MQTSFYGRLPVFINDYPGKEKKLFLNSFN